MIPPLGTLRLESRWRTVTADRFCDHRPFHSRVTRCPLGMFQTTVQPLSALPELVTFTPAVKVLAVWLVMVYSKLHALAAHAGTEETAQTHGLRAKSQSGFLR